MIQLAALIDGKPVATAGRGTGRGPVDRRGDGRHRRLRPSRDRRRGARGGRGRAVLAAGGRARAGPAARRLSALIERDVASLGRLESQQTGKPLRQGLRDAEITVRYFDFYASAVETFYGSAFSLDERTMVHTRWEPHGVTAHIIPWNYPLQILGRSVAPPWPWVTAWCSSPPRRHRSPR